MTYIRSTSGKQLSCKGGRPIKRCKETSKLPGEVGMTVEASDGNNLVNCLKIKAVNYILVILYFIS